MIAGMPSRLRVLAAALLAGCATAPAPAPDAAAETLVDLFGSHTPDPEVLALAGLAPRMTGTQPDPVEVKRRLLATGRFQVVEPFEWHVGQRRWLFIDLVDLGAPPPPKMRAAPTGHVDLPSSTVALAHDFEAAFQQEIAGATRGDEWLEGRLLRRFAPARAVEQRLLAQGLAHQAVLEQAVLQDADRDRREAAALALGYAGDLAHAATFLIEATRDADSDVRQTASRQLEFLLRQQRCKEPAFVLPAEPFFEQLRQPHVLERQKAGALLFELARSDREVARRLREEVWPRVQSLERAQLHVARRVMAYRVGSYRRDPPLTYDEIGALIERDHPEDTGWWKNMTALPGRKQSWEQPCAGYR